MIQLDEITYADTNYIQKLEAWRQALLAKVGDIDGMLGVAGAANTVMPSALKELYDRRGIVGEASYKPVAATLSAPSYNLTVAAGGYVDASLIFYQKTTSTLISLLGFSTGTLYVNLTGGGTPQVGTAADTTTTWQFSWNATTHVVSAVARYAGVAILLDGDDVAACLASVARAKSFTKIATRLEEIEVLLGKAIQTPASADNVAINWSLGGTARVLLDRATTTFAFSGAYDGQRLVLEVTQDGVGGRGVAFGAEVLPGVDFTLPIPLSAGTGKTDLIGFIYKDGIGYRYASLARGY